MEHKNIIHNVIDELERAIDRLKEIGEFEYNSITPDDELISDMQMSIERLSDLL